MPRKQYIKHRTCNKIPYQALSTFSQGINLKSLIQNSNKKKSIPSQNSELPDREMKFKRTLRSQVTVFTDFTSFFCSRFLTAKHLDI